VPVQAPTAEPAVRSAEEPKPAPTVAQQEAIPEPEKLPLKPAAQVPHLPTEVRKPLALTPRRVIVAHPPRAKTSGNNTHGTVGDFAFLGPDSQLIASGGNDDRVRVHDIRSGKQVFASGRLGKDVDHIIACQDGRFAAETYSGKVAIFTRKGDAIRKHKVYNGSMGGLVGWTEDCKYILHAQFLAALEVVDASSGQVTAEIPARGMRWFSLHDDRMLHAQGEQWSLWTYTGQPQTSRSKAVELPSELGGARLVQAHVISDGMLVEYCQTGTCTTLLLNGAGQPMAEATFDATHSVWVMTLGSNLELSPDQRFLFFYRDGLAPEVVELATGRRAVMELVPRTMSSTVTAAFSPHEPGLLAEAMTPEPNKITLFELGDAATDK